jgi:ribose/xylose/arabinose/galactoside ABC-type transport system permease subunit
MKSMDPNPSRAPALLDYLRRPFSRSESGLLLAIIVVAMLTMIADSQHVYWYRPKGSIQDILRQTAMLGIFSLGAAIVIISGGIDLSAGSMIAFSGTICATLMLLIQPDSFDPKIASPLRPGVVALGICGTLVVGLLVGSFHAWLITVVDLPPFVATLATLVGLRSLARAMIENVTKLVYGGAGSTQIQIHDDQFLEMTASVPLRVAIFLILAGVAWVLLSRTVTGRHLYAMGGNESAARLSGIRTDGLKWFAYCISALLSSIAGILYIGEQATADPQTLGQGYELFAIAAAVVGGCSLKGGVGTIPGTVLGALFLRTVIDGVAKVIKSNAQVYEGLIVGAVVVVAVAFNQFREAGRRGKKFFGGALGWVTILNLTLLAGVLAAIFGQLTDMNAKTLGMVAGSVGLVVVLLVRFLENRRRSEVTP